MKTRIQENRLKKTTTKELNFNELFYISKVQRQLLKKYIFWFVKRFLNI